MLAAWHYGVGTCALAAAVTYPDVLRSLLNIPESKRIVVGVALGYPDFSSPAVKFRTDREPLERLVSWHGFE
jgi:nitroreductase